MGYSSSTFIVSIAMTVIEIIAFMHLKKPISPQGASLALIAGIFGGLGLWAFITSLSQGKVGISAGIRGLSVAISAILATVFLGEKMNPQQAIGLLVAIASIWMMST